MGKKKSKKQSKASVHNASWGPWAEKIEAIGKKFGQLVADTTEEKRAELEVRPSASDEYRETVPLVGSDHALGVKRESASTLVLADGTPVMPGNGDIPSQQFLVKSGVHIGTESIGTDAWEVYRLPDGSLYRVVDYPKENPALGMVYPYNKVPPLYRRPDLTRVVTKEERKRFEDTTATDARVAARVEMSLLRRQVQRSEREQAIRRARHILEQTLAPWQIEALHRYGYFDIVTIHGHRYRVVPGETPVFYRLSPRDEPVIRYRIKNEEALPDAKMALILTLRTSEEGVIEQCIRQDHFSASWPRQPAPEFGPTLARVSALEFAS